MLNSIKYLTIGFSNTLFLFSIRMFDFNLFVKSHHLIRRDTNCMVITLASLGAKVQSPHIRRDIVLHQRTPRFQSLHSIVNANSSTSSLIEVSMQDNFFDHFH